MQLATLPDWSPGWKKSFGLQREPVQYNFHDSYNNHKNKNEFGSKKKWHLWQDLIYEILKKENVWTFSLKYEHDYHTVLLLLFIKSFYS